jgi:hypothetical protein
MTEWSLSTLLAGLHDEIERKLETVRNTFGHPVTKGDASEKVWLELLQTYLPGRYKAARAFVVDSKGTFSDQIDVVIFDRQYSPFIFHFEDQIFVPSESVYAVFEAKQTINAEHVNYARRKLQSVQNLHRTSLPIPHAGGVFPAKALIPILGGILTFDSDWRPPLGPSLVSALGMDRSDRLDLGCVASHGHFWLERQRDEYQIIEGRKPATAFLFRLISMLQFSGTVPMVDILAYADWLSK